jgi:large subunit ribosomal protein L29
VRTDELRELPVSEVRRHLEETREELFNLRFQGATGQLENYKRLGVMRREIARTLTVLRERELGIIREVLGGEEGEPEPEGGAPERGRRRRRLRRAGEEEQEGGEDGGAATAAARSDDEEQE